MEIPPEIEVSEQTIVDKYIEQHYKGPEAESCKNIMKHIDDKVFIGIDDISAWGWNVTSKIYVLGSVKTYAHTIKCHDGWLVNPVEDLIKLDDTWLKLA